MTNKLMTIEEDVGRWRKLATDNPDRPPPKGINRLELVYWTKSEPHHLVLQYGRPYSHSEPEWFSWEEYSGHSFNSTTESQSLANHLEHDGHKYESWRYVVPPPRPVRQEPAKPVACSPDGSFMKQLLILGCMVKQVTVLIHRGPDAIAFEIGGGPLAYPAMPEEPTYFKVSTAPGRSKEWLRQMEVDLSLVTVISAKLGQLPGFPESYGS